MSAQDEPPKWPLERVESARAYVRKHAAPHGLETECMTAFEQYIQAGDSPSEAASCALYDWDC